MIFKKLVSFFLSLLAFVGLLFAQPAQKVSGKAKKLFDVALENYRHKEFSEALSTLEKAIEKQPDYIEAYILKAEISSYQGLNIATIESYEKVLELWPNPKPSIYYSLANAEFKEGLYDDSKATLDILLQKDNLGPSLEEDATKLSKNAEFASWAIKNPVPFNPENLGLNVNTSEEDYHPCLTLDENTLIFTRKEKEGFDRYGNPNYKEDFYYSRKTNEGWGLAENMGPPLNTKSNEGAQSISMDGRYMYFTACHRPDGVGSCDIYRAYNTADGWGEPENLGKALNSQKWDSQPTISADGRTLFFVSSRAGGKGQKDIWYSVLGFDGEWGKPQVCSFNSEGNELSPFIHPDGQTLYFASDGYPGMGGFDIFLVRKNEDGEWGTPINLGYPINTYNDEHGLIVNPKGNKAYFASDREETIGKLDIYAFALYEDARPNAVGYAEGMVRDMVTKKGLHSTLEMVDLSTEEVVATALSDEKDGTYKIALPSNRNYAANVTSPGYLFHSENFTLKSETGEEVYLTMVIDLQKIEIGKSVVLKNIFFETGSFKLATESKAELNKLVTFLQQNPDLKIEIGGHTDNVGSAKDNQILSENRAKSVYNYLLKNQIELNRLSFKGYGQNKPIDTNETEKGRANNRRTEFRVVGI